MRWFRRAGLGRAVGAHTVPAPCVREVANPVLPCDGSGGLASAVLSARILCPVGILPDFWKGLRCVCRALEGDGADRNLPILETRPFRGVGGQFLDRRLVVFSRGSTWTCSGVTSRDGFGTS